MAADFPERTRALVSTAGGETVFVRLAVSAAEQERRLGNPDRAAFGKLRSLDLLRELRSALTACEAAMPEPVLTLDTARTTPAEAARSIARLLETAPGRGDGDGTRPVTVA